MEGPLHVLVVDDQISMRSILKRMLHQMGYFQSIEDAGDGEEAWEKIGTHVFHLVITDVQMPRLDGIGLLKRCRADNHLRELPFLIISGEAMPELVARAGEWGAYDYIVKPFSYTFLKERVESIFTRLNSPEESLFREVERLKENGFVKEALQRIGRFEQVAASPKVKWLNLKGECFMELGEMEEAVACLEKALEMSDIHLPSHKTYANLMERLGNLDKAIEALAKADQLSPLEVDRKLALGKLMLQTGRDDEGKVFLQKALRQSSPEEREAYRLKVAEVYLANNHFEEAEKLYIKALRADPSQIETYNRLGIALRRQGKLKEAERYYLIALKGHPDNAPILYNLGVLYMNQNEGEKASKLLKRALEIDPELTKAEEALGQIAAQAAGAK